jgi:hypothetical protein
MPYKKGTHAIVLVEKSYHEKLKEYAKRNKRTIQASLQIIIDRHCL